MSNYTKLRELLAAAPPGEWKKGGSTKHSYFIDVIQGKRIVCEDADHQDADLIVALHNSAEELIEKAENYDRLYAVALEYVTDSYRPEPKYDAMRFDALKEELLARRPNGAG